MPKIDASLNEYQPLAESLSMINRKGLFSARN